ncbi:hypothetical protein BsWGS_18591 [Bradybaena similaris]
MSWANSPSARLTRSYRSGSLSTTAQNTLSMQSSTSLQTSSASSMSSTESLHSSTSETSSTKQQTVNVQKLYLLLPNHKCPNKKNCPFHPPEEQEEELEEAEVTLVNKRRAMSLASHEMITEQLLAEKLAKINQQISSNLLEGHKLHFPRKTSHDITLPSAEIDRLRFDHYSSESVPGAGSTREESVASDYDLDSGVTFDSCSDREMDEESLPLIQEEVVVPDIVITEKFQLKTEDEPDTDQQQNTEVQATVQINEETPIVATEGPETSATIAIEEHVPETHSKPRFLKELEYLTVTEGSLVRLECVVAGSPQPDIQWFKNNSQIDDIEGYKIQTTVDGTSTLTIERARVEDSGSYKCVAENISGSASTESKIRVQKAVDEAPSPPTYRLPEAKEVKQQPLLAPPEFTTTLKNRTAPEGVTVRLTCSVVGIPQPKLRWFKNDKEIFDGPDYTFTSHGGLSSLEVVYVKQSLAGKYTVQASNTEGTTSCSCVLEVEGDEKIEELELDFQRPKFIRKIEDVQVREGQDATFTCTAMGKPMPAFKWQKDMINVTASDHVEMESNNQGHAHLTLKNVKPSDNGLYYCVAHSKAGRAKCTAYLHVKAKSSSPVTNSQKEKDERITVQARKESSVERGGNLGSPPSLELLLPDSLDIVVGGRLKLDCSVQGYPMPLVTWHKGDRGLMYSQRHRIIPCGTLHTMEIPQVMALDKGEYIVRATNVYGTVQSSCYVNILPGGSKFSLSDYERQAVITVTKEYLQAPYFVKHLPKSIDAVLGMNIRLDCLLRDKIELVEWSKSKSPAQDLEKVKKDLVDEGFHGEFIPSGARPHEHQSEDRKLTDAKKARSPGQDDKVTERLSFTRNLCNLEQQPGSDAVFECTTAGSPDPDIKWYKDGQLLASNDRVRKATAGSTHTLRIKDVRGSDAGEYVCKASGPAGAKSSGAFLAVSDVREIKPKAPLDEKEKVASVDSIIKEQAARQETREIPDKVEKPSFREPLPKTTSANQGDDVELTCQLTSSDVSSVKWELDGREIPKETKYAVSSDERSNLQKLIIKSVRESDSGKYTCVIYLKDGDLVHSSTKLNVTAGKPEPEHKTEEVKPHFTSLLQDTVVRDGEGLVLECDIEGNPRPQISWFRDGLEILDSQDFQISTIGSHCKLQIQDIYPEDEGTYSCRAVNNLGEDVSSCYVSVEDLGEDMSADSASTASSRSFDKARARRVEAPEEVKKKTKKGQEKPEVPPELVVKPRRQFVDENSNAKFKASFDGPQSTVLFWSKDGQVLSDSDHFKMYEADGFHFLEVQKVSAEDNGMYSVTVQNLAGSDTAEAELEVFEKPKLLSRSGPEWEQSLQDLTVEEGDVGVELVCSCRDLTQPSARWFHNGKEVFSGFHMKLQHVAQTATLTIKEVQERDAGEFKCVMTGKNGELETSCNLIIKSQEEMEPPVFVKELHDMEVEEGDKLELDVEVKGSSPMKVCWYHNSVEITLDSPQYLITAVGYVHTLTQLNATSASSGEYVCGAYNDIDSTETFCFIEVREVEHPDPPDFVLHPSNLAAHEGESTTFTCQVKGQPMPTVLWKKEGAVIVNNHKFKITRIGDNHSLKICNLDHDDAGEYTCYLRNTEGETSHVCSLDVLGRKHSRKSQSVDAMKTRSAAFPDTQEMSQFSNQTKPHEKHLMTTETTNGNTEQASLFKKDGIDNTQVQASRRTPKASYEKTVGGNTLNHLQNSSSIDSNNYPKPYHVQDMRGNTELQHTFPESVTDVQSAPYKVYQEMKETRNVANNEFMDSNSSKVSYKSTRVQPGESTLQSNETDFKSVMFTNNANELIKNEFMFENVKGQALKSEQKYAQTVQISNTAPSREFTPDLNPSSPLLSSKLSSLSYEKKDHNLVKDFAYKANDTTSEVKPAAVQPIIDTSIVGNVYSVPDESPTQTVAQSWRRHRKGNSPPSSYQHFSTDEGSPDFKQVQEGFQTSYREKGNSLFQSEVQVVDSRTHDRRNQTSSSSSTEDYTMFLNAPSAAGHRDHRSDNYHANERDHLAAKSAASKHQPQKVNLQQLSACKVSISEFNPSEPQSDAFKLEVTSITASVPLRQSLSSSRPNSNSHSVTASTYHTPYDVDIKQEDEDVFTSNTGVRKSTHQEPVQTVKVNETTHNLQTSGSVYKGNKSSWDIKDDKTSILPGNHTYDKISHVFDKENPTAKSSIRFSENIKSFQENNKENKRSTYRLPTASRHEISPNSHTVVPGSSVPPAGTSNVVVDFRTVKLKPTAPKVKDNADLSKSKFMSKSTESIFTDVRLKPVLKTENSWKRSELASNSDRIRASSRSSDLSKLLPISSYHISTRNIPSTKATVNATSTTSKFSDSLKVFGGGGDEKSKPFNQYAKYSKFTPGTKFRTTAGKHEKVSSGGVTRSNSHKKSKGIGAKFEAAIKDIKTTQQVSYASSHLAKSKTVVKPPTQATSGILRQPPTQAASTEYASKRVSNQYRKPEDDISAERVWAKTAGQSSAANVVLDSGDDSYRERVSDWVKKRQSVNVDVTSTLSSNENTQADTKMQSATSIENPQWSRRNLEANELNNMNIAVSNDTQSVYSINAHSSNRHSEDRIRTKSGASQLLSSLDANLVGPQTSKDTTRYRPENSRLSHFNTDSRVSHSDQQAAARLNDTTKLTLVSAVDSTKKSTEINLVKSPSQPLFNQSALHSHDPVAVSKGDVPLHVNSAASEDRTTGTFKSQIVMIPKTTVSTKPSFTIGTLPRAKSTGNIAVLETQSTDPAAVASTTFTSAEESVTNTVVPQVSFTSISTAMETSPTVPGTIYHLAGNTFKEPETKSISLVTTQGSNSTRHTEAIPVGVFGAKEFSLRESCKESQLDYQEPSLMHSRASGAKQKSMRHIPLYPVNDSELFPHTDMDISCMTDLDSIISTTSMSSSSSEASNVTADSGYTRRLTSNDRIQAVNEVLHRGSWNHQADPGIHNDALKYHKENDHEMKRNLWETMEDSDYTPINCNTNTTNRHLGIEQKHAHSERIKHETVDVTTVPNSSKQIEREDYTQIHGSKSARGNDKQTGHHLMNVSEDIALKSASASKESECSAGVKEDIVSDSIPRFEYISRRQRRQLESHVPVTSHSIPKMDNSGTGKDRLSHLNAQDNVTHHEPFPYKKLPVSYENSPKEESLSTTENSLSVSRSKRAEPIDEASSNIPFRVRKTEVGTGSVNILKNVQNERNILSKDTLESVNTVPQKLYTGQGENVSTNSRSSDVKEVGNVGGQTNNSRQGVSDQSSTMLLRQRWRHSRQQNTEISLDKNTASSADATQDAETLPKSSAGAISAAPSTPPHTSTTAHRFSTPPPSLAGPHCPPSFPIPLQDVNVMYGSQAVLRCQVTGNPRPDVKWLLNQTPLEQSDKIDIVYHDNTAQLTITKTSAEHQGDFTCWAKNSQGTVSSHCALRIKDDHSQNLSCQTMQTATRSTTGDMSGVLSTSNNTEQTIINISNGKATYAPVGRPCVSVKNSTSVSLSWSGTSRDESEVIYYIVEGKEVEDKAWDIFIPRCKQFPCVIEDLKPGASYQFRILAAYKHGVSPPSEPSETVMTLESVALTNDFKSEGQLPFRPREVQINTKDNFEDLYEKEKEVGKGKFGVVYRCKQKTDGSVWAAKVVRCREKEKASIRREIAVMNKLHHPKLLLLWDAFESPRQMVLVMEYVGAGELFERVIGDDYVLTENDCIHFVRQICEGVSYMHNNSILHLDLKPENILCVAENSNRIKIIDFGLAQFYTPGQGTKVLFGTPEFIAPEVINYDEISFATDMWSLGVICYVLLSGLSPFLGDTDSETLASVTTGEYDFDDEAFDEISDMAKDFISKLLVKRKERRMLTEQCLAHSWLNQDEVDGIPGKRLNTERLKKFMIRRKWLKTGNAVKAVSRLLKSNSQTGFGINFQSSNNATSTMLSHMNSLESTLRMTEASDDDDANQSELNSKESDNTPDISQHFHSVEESFKGAKENGSSTKTESNSTKSSVLCENQGDNGASSERMTNSVETNNAELLSQIIPRRLRESTVKTDETKDLIPSSSQYSSERVKDLNQDFVKTEAYSVSSVSQESNNVPSASSLTSVQKKSDELLSSSPLSNRISPQSNNRRTDVNQVLQTLSQAPAFTKPMIRCKTCLGDVARFDVTVSGDPLPHVTWFFEDEEIISDTRHMVRSNEKTRSFSLNIRNVEEDDEGEYTCKAVNSLGESSCSAELIVLEL